MSLRTSDWTEILVNTLLFLLSAFMRRHGEDAAQEIVSRVSNDLASGSSTPRPFKLSELAKLTAFSEQVDGLSEKEAYRVSQGTST